jgi:hypothetical protein
VARASRFVSQELPRSARTGRLAGEAGVQYALRIRNACLVAAAFADAGITAIVTDTIINEGLESLIEIERIEHVGRQITGIR